MKKILFIAVITTAISTKSFSQAAFGIQAGPNVSFNQTEMNNDDDVSNKAKWGFVGGFVADVPLGPVSFRPELNFIQKGYKNETSSTNLGITTTSVSKVRLNYIEVPLNFVYNIDACHGKVFFGVGPNFGLGLSGKSKYTNTANIGGTGATQSGTTDVKFDGEDKDDGNAHLKRFDFGANALAGYQCTSGLFFTAGFTLGLTDISPNGIDNDGSDEFTQKNHGLNLKVGYLFGCHNKNTKTNTSTGSSSGSGTF